MITFCVSETEDYRAQKLLVLFVLETYPIIRPTKVLRYDINENSEAIPGFDPGDAMPIYHHIPAQMAMQIMEYPQLIRNIKINLMMN